MIALGLILLVLSGALTAGIVLSNTDPVSAAAFGVSLSNVSIGGLFLSGAVAGLVFGLGVTLMLAGAARKRARRRGLKSQVEAVRTERESLAEKNAQLQEELELERSTRVTPASDDDDPTDAGRHASHNGASAGGTGLLSR